MGLKCGIVGLPNVGKSTFFNALCQNSQAQAANYPFCTIEPNKAVVPVCDDRLDKIAQIALSESVVQAKIEFIDIAGLIKGASKGEGCGNKFLSHIGQVDLIIHLVRCFDDNNITHVAGKTDPLSDIDTIETELLLYDLDKLEKKIKELSKKVNALDKKIIEQKRLINDLIKHLTQGLLINQYPKIDQYKSEITQLFLLTSKPIIYACNINQEDLPNGNKYSSSVVDKASKNNIPAIVVCAKFEDEISIFDDVADKQASLKELGITESSITKVIKCAYKSLGLNSYFTAGPKEARMWPVKIGANAKQAARLIHSDISDGFIKAEVISYQDYIQYGDRANEKGLLKIEGDKYIVQDGDIINFKFNKTKQGKNK